MVTVPQRLAVYRAGYIPSEPIHAAPDVLAATSLLSIGIVPYVASYTLGGVTTVATSIISIGVGGLAPGIGEGAATTEIMIGVVPITPVVVIDVGGTPTTLIAIGVVPVAPNSNISPPIIVSTTMIGIGIGQFALTSSVATPCPINPCLLAVIRPQRTNELPVLDQVNVTTEVSIAIEFEPMGIRVGESCTINPCLLSVFLGHTPVVLETDDICVINPALLLVNPPHRQHPVPAALPYTIVVCIGIVPIAPTIPASTCTINPCLLSVFVRSKIPPLAVVDVVGTSLLCIGITPLSPGAFFSGPRIDALEIGIVPCPPSFASETCGHAVWVLPQRDTEWLMPIHR